MLAADEQKERSWIHLRVQNAFDLKRPYALQMCVYSWALPQVTHNEHMRKRPDRGRFRDV